VQSRAKFGAKFCVKSSVVWIFLGDWSGDLPVSMVGQKEIIERARSRERRVRERRPHMVSSHNRRVSRNPRRCSREDRKKKSQTRSQKISTRYVLDVSSHITSLRKIADSSGKKGYRKSHQITKESASRFMHM
jgi:hypothetical protein